MSVMAQPDDDLELSRALFASATARLEGALELCVVGQAVQSSANAALISTEVLTALEASLNLIRVAESLTCEPAE